MKREGWSRTGIPAQFDISSSASRLALMGIACVVALTFSNGASAQSSRALGASDAASIRTLRLVSAAPQVSILDTTREQVNRALQSTYIPPGTGGAGILGAVIGAAIGEAILRARLTRVMEEIALAWPKLTEALGSFDPVDALANELEATATGDTRFVVNDFERVSGKAPKEMPLSRAGDSDDHGTLLLESRMWLSEDLNVFQIEASARLVRPRGSGDIYQQSFRFEAPAIGAKSIKEAIDIWSADEAVLFRGVVSMGAATLARMLHLDLLDRKAPWPGTRTVRNSEVGRSGGFIDGSAGELLEQYRSVLILRDTRQLRAFVHASRFDAKLAEEGLQMRLARDDSGSRVTRPVTLDELRGLLGRN